MRILGIDPGLATVGIGLVESENAHSTKALEWMTITTPAGMPMEQRLCEIHDDLATIIKEWQPTEAIVEQLFFETNRTTAMSVSQARGVILYCLGAHHIPIREITPMQLKQNIAGDGKADKKQVQLMTARLLNLGEIPSPDDAADALGLALYGAITHQLIMNN